MATTVKVRVRVSTSSAAGFFSLIEFACSLSLTSHIQTHPKYYMASWKGLPTTLLRKRQDRGPQYIVGLIGVVHWIGGQDNFVDM